MEAIGIKPHPVGGERLTDYFARNIFYWVRFYVCSLVLSSFIRTYYFLLHTPFFLFVIHELINVSNISWFLETKHKKKNNETKPQLYGDGPRERRNCLFVCPENGSLVWLPKKKRKNPKIDVIIQFHLVTPVVCVWLIGRPLFCRYSAVEHGWGYFLIFLLPFYRILFIICVTWLIRVYFQIVGCWLLLVFGPISPTCST